MQPSDFEKSKELFDKILELWGEDIFDYLLLKEKESETKIDDFLVEKIREWLL